MRATMRMLANIKPERFLEAGNPTGLTGLFTHPSPRSTLLYLYSSTLEKLKAIPEYSVYRQSTEALAKHRYNAVDSIKPPGYEEWAKRAKEKVWKYRSVLMDQNQGPHRIDTVGESVYVVTEGPGEIDERVIERDGQDQTPSGSGSNAGTVNQSSQRRGYRSDIDETNWEPEPPLEASQILELENQIGGGLIEEVIQVAEGELKLLDTMIQSKVWEELEEKAPQGQWEYFSRDQHTPGTQEPPNK
ncbi:hypothetical protein MMC29_007504 [Sticta canariensis]|nr:hypothetical protein [Sticta canariensis]